MIADSRLHEGMLNGTALDRFEIESLCEELLETRRRLAELGYEARRESIEILELGVRAYNALKKLGLETLGDVADKTRAELMGLRNFGRISRLQVEYELDKHGLRLATTMKGYTLADISPCDISACAKPTRYRCDLCGSAVCAPDQKNHRRSCRRNN